MASETIVAVFDTAAHAEAAVSALIADGVPASAIEHYARDQGVTDQTPVGTDVNPGSAHRGFWGWLTGEQETASSHHALYDQSIQTGGTVVTVISDGTNIDQIYNVLEAHSPVDLDERHSQYNETGAYGSSYSGGTATGAGTLGTAAMGTAAVGTAAVGTAAVGTGAMGTAATGKSTEEVIALSEESLQVGKRVVDRGTTRVRRYVMERPVEEQIRLRNETVSVFRRPVTGSATIGSDAFSDREIVVNETSEEAVVAKSAHVVEEVVVQKGVEERVETVRDTLRKEEVEIEAPTTGLGATAATSKPRI